MENLTNSELLISKEKVSKQFCRSSGNRISMSHPENNRLVYTKRRPEVNLKSNFAAFKEQTRLNNFPVLDEADCSDINGVNSCTQTSKTILQLAELETGYLSPDSLTSSPDKEINTETQKFINPNQNFTSCSENFDMSIPYMRKKNIQNYLDECYDTKKSPRGENFNPYLKPSLTSTFLAKKLNEEPFPMYGSRSHFLQQTSPLRNLSSCSPKSSFKSQSCFETNTSKNYTAKKDFVPCSRFTIKNIKNQERVDEKLPLVSWSNTKTIDGKINKPSDNKLPKKYVKKRGTSFMSPTIASEQRNQQRFIKSFDCLMSPTKRGKSLSPNRISNAHSTVNPNENFNDDTQSQVSSYKSGNLKRTSRYKYYNGVKSSSLLEYNTNDNQLEIDLSRLNIKSPKIQSSLPSSTISTENLLFQIMTHVKDNDWSTSLKGLAEVTDCCRSMDTDLLIPHMTTINQKLLQWLRSPRSHVSRTACQIAGHLFETMKDTRRPEFDDIVEALLSKTADSNKFIRKDANLSLDCMVTHIPIYHAVKSLCLKGPCHKNPFVRTATLRLIVCAVVIAGPDIILSLPGHEPTRKRIIYFFPQFLFDKHLETRKYGERLFKIFSKEENFEYYLKKYLDLNDINRISIILKLRDIKRR